MGLKLKLAGDEVVYIGRAKLQNGPQDAEIVITGVDVPILRQKERILETEANTACERLHILIENMYLLEDNSLYDKYIDMSNQISQAAPSLRIYIALVSERIVAGELYQALKRMKAVIEHERMLLSHQNLDRAPRAIN